MKERRFSVMSKTVFAIITLLFNQLGIPSFVTGNTKKGIMTIVSGAITLGVVAFINAIKGIINAIKIFKMTDEEYEAADKATLVDAIVFFCKED